MNKTNLMRREQAGCDKDVVRVLILTETLNVGGLEKYTLLQVRFTDRDCYQITIGYVKDGPLRAKYEALDISLFNYSDTLRILRRVWGRKIPLIYPHRILKPVRRVARFVREEDIDIIQTNGIFSYVVGAIVSRITGVPTIRIKGNIMKYAERLHYRLFKYLPFAKWTDRHVVFTRLQKEELLSLGLPPEKIYDVGGYGVDLSEFHPQRSGVSARRELGIPLDAPVIGQAGRLVKSKRFDFMIHAARIVVARFPQAVFLIVGDGPERERLEQLVDKLELRQNVIFTGLRLDMPRIVAAFDVAVFTMENTPGGTANWEAMASGKPIVCTNSDESLDTALIEDGVTGFVVPPNDLRSFAEAIITLIKDPDLRHKMGANARSACEKWGDFGRIVVPRLAQLYDELTEKR